MGFWRRVMGRNPHPSSPRPASPRKPPAAACQPSPGSFQARLWNKAYDALKVDEPETVEAYEKFLSAELHHQGSPPTTNSAEPPEPRWRQMGRLVEARLQRTAREAAIKQQIGDGIQTVSVVRDLVDKAVQAAPEAAIAWVGVSFALEVLSNPFTKPRINRGALLQKRIARNTVEINRVKVGLTLVSLHIRCTSGHRAPLLAPETLHFQQGQPLFCIEVIALLLQ